MDPIKNLCGHDPVDEGERRSAAEAGPSPATVAARHAAAERLRAATYDFDALAEQDAIDLADQEQWADPTASSTIVAASN